MCTVGIVSATTADDSMLEMRFPKRSTATTTPSMPPSARGPVAVQLGLLYGGDFCAEVGGIAAARRDRGGQRREHVAAMKRGADIAHTEFHQPRVVDLDHAIDFSARRERR